MRQWCCSSSKREQPTRLPLQRSSLPTSEMLSHALGKTSSTRCGVFFLFYIKKNQNFKNICPFRKISKIYPGRPPQGRQDFNVIFLKFAKRSLVGGVWREGVLSPPPRAIGACRPPTGDRGSPTLYKSWPPIPSHLSPKNTPKIQKKREGWGEALPNCALVIYR